VTRQRSEGLLVALQASAVAASQLPRPNANTSAIRMRQLRFAKQFWLAMLSVASISVSLICQLQRRLSG
jgi:hypothetical protein